MGVDIQRVAKAGRAKRPAKGTGISFFWSWYPFFGTCLKEKGQDDFPPPPHTRAQRAVERACPGSGLVQLSGRQGDQEGLILSLRSLRCLARIRTVASIFDLRHRY